MFNRKETKHTGFGLFSFLRLLLSFAMLIILAVGSYQAFKYFSGTDPLKADPQALVTSIINNGDWGMVLSDIPRVRNVNDLKAVLKEVKGLGQGIKISTGSMDLVALKIEVSPTPRDPAKLVLKFALVSDSHDQNDNLTKALNQAKDEGAKFVIGLGDYTTAGEMGQLLVAKEVFQKTGLPYYLTAGDHDLWAARDKSLSPTAYFSQTFGSSYQSFADSNIRFIIVYNSDNYFGIDPLQMDFLKGELERGQATKPLDIFVMMHEPLYHPSSDHVMGKESPKLVDQANFFIEELANNKVSEVFSGHTHYYSRYTEPKTGLKMTSVGAVTDNPNAQKPRFALVDVFSDGSYNVEDLEIK